MLGHTNYSAAGTVVRHAHVMGPVWMCVSLRFFRLASGKIAHANTSSALTLPYWLPARAHYRIHALHDSRLVPPHHPAPPRLAPIVSAYVLAAMNAPGWRSESVCMVHIAHRYRQRRRSPADRTVELICRLLACVHIKVCSMLRGGAYFPTCYQCRRPMLEGACSLTCCKCRRLRM